MNQKKQIALDHLRQQIEDGEQDCVAIMLDTDGTILNWNGEIEKVKGYNGYEIIGQHISIFYLPQDREKKLADELMAKALRDGEARHIGVRVRKNGTTFWGSIRLTPLYDNNGDHIGFIKITKQLKEGQAK